MAVMHHKLGSWFWRVSPILVSLAVGSLASGQTPAILTNGTTNSGDYSRSFAPGGLISIFGTNLANSIAQPAAYPLPTSLGGASVELVGTGALVPLWYASPTQINGQLPYDLPPGPVQVRVRTGTGVSNIDTITLTARAPKIFSVDMSGQGSAVATNTRYTVLAATNPSAAADTVFLWMNSLGATTGNPVAGTPAPGLTPGSQLSTVNAPVTATVNGIDAPVTFAGLSPGSVGLYQVNIRMPFVVLTGPLNVRVTVEGVSSQTNVTVPYRQLGFYWSLLGGKAVSGQTMNGVAGATSALSFRHSDAVTWGNEGLNNWTKNTGMGTQYSAASGVALTLRNGTAIVYDNNGLETASYGSFYDNTNGAANAQKPGLTDLFSMSNYFPLTFAGYFRLAQATTVTEIIGYFDTLGSLDLPFDPANPYVRYRMNIWSNATGNLPTDTKNFTGNIFTSDTVAGTFAYSDTGVKILSSSSKDVPKPIYRLSYKLAAPLNLPAGDYWFGHDASVRAQPAASSTAQAVTTEGLRQLMSVQQPRSKDTVRFNFFGRELSMEDSWNLPEAVVVRPSAPIAQ